jgi:hypothetical protein
MAKKASCPYSKKRTAFSKGGDCPILGKMAECPMGSKLKDCPFASKMKNCPPLKSGCPFFAKVCTNSNSN